MHEQGDREKGILESLGIDQFKAVDKADILEFGNIR